ncbi:hypothetical protein FPZ12_034055 [Amycolatopsis acidicola]|uniref:Uncharacterized protein n=1 Tax=Amycolatopsis acidicola TaxID=2596893 RepID=A0A5N0UQN1_9PSEU|nr:hypothetical protein [Amycolatopsis acidicola]KAA9153606.1 hypothetical protein FPZ12_034055 [Amycolatopsis acidicola]
MLKAPQRPADEPTVRLRLPASLTAPSEPVFVDSSGRRLLWLRLALFGVAIACVVFVVALVLSVTAGGVSPSVAASIPTTASK